MDSSCAAKKNLYKNCLRVGRTWACSEKKTQHSCCTHTLCVCTQVLWASAHWAAQKEHSGCSHIPCMCITWTYSVDCALRACTSSRAFPCSAGLYPFGDQSTLRPGQLSQCGIPYLNVASSSMWHPLSQCGIPSYETTSVPAS
jgi:hypothetical protein